MTKERDQAAISATTRELETDIVTEFLQRLCRRVARGIREQADSTGDPRATGDEADSLRRVPALSESRRIAHPAGGARVRRGARPRCYAVRNEIRS